MDDIVKMPIVATKLTFLSTEFSKYLINTDHNIYITITISFNQMCNLKTIFCSNNN